jgi:peptidoglycan/xylan/chitin deacetylase (PgdA/CDA1 family)
MNIPILMYHKIPDIPENDGTNLSVQASEFELHVNHLKKKGYYTMLLSELSGMLKDGRTPPGRPVVITFDDALESVGRFAKPILDSAGYKAVVFAVADAIGGHNFWDDGKNLPKTGCMDISSLSELLAAGWEIGSHGLTHAGLPECTPDKLREEIYGSKQKLEKLFHTPVKSFCYPYGAWNENVRKTASESYDSACAITVKTSSVTKDMYALKRIYIKTSDSLNDFKRKISPWYLAYRSLRKR